MNLSQEVVLLTSMKQASPVPKKTTFKLGYNKHPVIANKMNSIGLFQLIYSTFKVCQLVKNVAP